MKTSPLPRRFASLATLSLALALMGASAASAEEKAAILLPGSANDQSWNALGYSILKSLEPHGFKTAYSENVADADEAEAPARLRQSGLPDRHGPFRTLRLRDGAGRA